VAHAGEHQQLLGVGDDEHRFEVAQGAVGAPLLHGLDGGLEEVAAVVVEVALELVEKGEGVAYRTGEAGDDLAFGQAAHLDGPTLDDRVAQADLAVADQGSDAVAVDADDGCAVETLHRRRGYHRGSQRPASGRRPLTARHETHILPISYATDWL